MKSCGPRVTVLTLTALALSLAGAACSSPPPTPAPAPAPAPVAQAVTVVPAQGGTCTPITNQISLCETTSECPGLPVDQTVFPQCGFMIHGDVLDPECFCGGVMCPIGIPATCNDAAALFASGLTVEEVCARAATRHCVDLAAVGNGSDTCKICLQNCNGDPRCSTACGC